MSRIAPSGAGTGPAGPVVVVGAAVVEVVGAAVVGVGAAVVEVGAAVVVGAPVVLVTSPGSGAGTELVGAFVGGAGTETSPSVTAMLHPEDARATVTNAAGIPKPCLDR
ncbi:MAG: hypothetical protein S0880_29220 [Actinomycetota bacterium]|nr:hypothetical protein [Actinomycetota bacterium]